MVERQFHLERLGEVESNETATIQFHQNVARWIPQFLEVTIPQLLEAISAEGQPRTESDPDYMARDSESTPVEDAAS
jgi:hypothetical protein